jgi:hypothetical protein
VYFGEEQIMRDTDCHSAVQEHREAVRLSWKSCHVPFGTILLACLVLASVLSAVLTIAAQGPVNPMR